MGKTFKVLIVDDDNTLLNIESAYIKRYMKQKYCDVSIVRQTEAFPALFELFDHGNSYDLIILDDQMPFLNGKDLLNSLLPLNADFLKRIVFISANADDIQEHFPKHNLHFLNKPFSYLNFKNLADNFFSPYKPISVKFS